MFPEQKKRPFQESCNLCFYAFKALSECHPLITQQFFISDRFLKTLYQFVNDSTEAHVTSQGYVQQVLKNFFSDLNPNLDDFILLIKKKPE